MLFFVEIFNLWGLVLVVDSPFPAIFFNIRDLIDSKSVPLIYRRSMNMFTGLYCLLWGRIFDEGIPAQLVS